MKKEGTFGAAALLAIAAVVGLSLQPGSKQSGETASRTAPVRHGDTTNKTPRAELGPGCRNVEERLQDFLETEEPIAPNDCYISGAPLGLRPSKQLAEKTSRLKFLIALLPDPLHTHQSVLFDQFTVAIQEGAQDEKYDFDSSWLPWEDGDQPYPLLGDQEAANLKRENRENQPGILLFRRAINCRDEMRKQPEAQKKCEDARHLGSGLGTPSKLSKSYRDGLVVFVVGEEATAGVHKEQFQNAFKWLDVLEKVGPGERRRAGILGPTFSGSLPSLTQALNDPRTAAWIRAGKSEPLEVYSGSVSGKDPVETFRFLNGDSVDFHSFVQNDDVILERFCSYLETEQHEHFDPRRVAILSEDETAYGKSGVESGDHGCRGQALNLYYPRDISSLRGAYQTKSLFDSGTSAPATDSQRRNLPTDLADPAGKVHDSIRSYGANQTPLVQEALLLEIVAALRDLHARYILLRGSNPLDQLFLTNFLRRMYPDGRVVIFGADLLFARERGTTGLGGSMTLSTYPLFPLARDWTENGCLPASDRAFSSDTAQGTYIALRTILNSGSLAVDPLDRKQCAVSATARNTPFLPSVTCDQNPIPDYAPPYWTSASRCEKTDTGVSCEYKGPMTWLSVIGRSRFWPVASLGTPETNPPERPVADCPADQGKSSKEPGRTLETPREMKVLLITLAVFAIFHAWCCWAGSYTAKPSFRAYFATDGDWRHFLLILIGSAAVAFSGIVAAWGCGVFSASAYQFAEPVSGLLAAIFIFVVALAAVVASGFTASELSVDPKTNWKRFYLIPCGAFVVAVALFLTALLTLDHSLRDDNRAFTYWRAMHLGSSASPAVPIIAVFAGLYLWFWLTLHGLALFGPDRPCLPSKDALILRDEHGIERHFLRMFSQEDAATPIEEAGRPFNSKVIVITVAVFALLMGTAWGLAGGVPIRGLGARSYALFIMLLFGLAVSLQITGAWRLYELWEELRRLLAFLDRIPLRRTLAVLRGFSWGSVWKMSGNVLEVRYKVISRQMESMNHAIAALQEYAKSSSDAADVKTAQDCLASLKDMRTAGRKFAIWYSERYTNPRAKDLSSFTAFQNSVAASTGTLLTHLLVPFWIKETHSLLMSSPKDAKASKEGDEEAHASDTSPQVPEEHIRNAEEFVCLNYLAFIQNILGRLRTLVMSILVLFLASTLCLSSYPFDPRQILSAVLIAMLLALGIVIVKVYAEMHRDATLSHVTNTRPGELGAEFWIKLFAFGFAPILGLLTRIFPGIGDFIFSWIQPNISSLR
jgi:hypothetical protein